MEQYRPKSKTPPQDLLRREATLWRHENGAKLRAVSAELGLWLRAAQTFIGWAHLGVWERLLYLVQEHGIELGMTFLDAPTCAHQKEAGARRKGALKLNETIVKRLAGLDV